MPSRPTPKRTPRITVTWLGHSAFIFTSPAGKVILSDPWLDNPKAPPGSKHPSRVDFIILSHGHGDHLGNAVNIAQETNARVLAIHELALYLQSRGLHRVEGMNKSGSTTIDGITFTMTHATHSSGIEPGGQILAGGDAAGFVVRLENGFTFYFAGDTGVFGDMKLIGEMYKPELVVLPIGGYFTMGPREAAAACRMLKPKYILCMHYGTFPLLAGTPAELKRLLPVSMRNRVHELTPGIPAQF